MSTLISIGALPPKSILTRLLLPLALCLATLWAAPAHTAEPWLPADDAVRQALAAHPAMLDAKAQRESRAAAAQASRSGPQETSFNIMPQGRWTRAPADRYPELQIGLERPLRLGGKADADGAIADAALDSARIALMDASHELTRELLALWFEVLRRAAASDAQDAALAQAEAFSTVVAARVKHGDAAQLDAMLAEADLQRARAASLGARSALRAAREELAAQFPGLAEPVAMPTALPPPPAQEREALRARYMSGSHEFMLARAEAERLQATAKRVDLERRGAPIVGAYAATERGGNENIIGISVTIPLGSTYRNAQARAAAADAVSAWARSRQAERKADAGFRLLWESLQGARQSALSLGEAASQQAKAAAKTAQAYRLGEAGIAEVLAARRGAAEADLQARSALIEAVGLQTRLSLDLHELWDFDE